MEMNLGMNLAQHPVEHAPLSTPKLTSEVYEQGFSLEQALRMLNDDPLDKRVLEAVLLKKWDNPDWKEHLDAPLIAHANAALVLKEAGFDCAIAIMNAGEPYSKLFSIMGIPYVKIDYSHHKREMTEPVIDGESIDVIRKKNKCLLVDIDIVTGKTVRSVYKWLVERYSPNIDGLYCGLSSWPGIPGIEGKTISCANSGRFLTQWRGMKRVTKNWPYDAKILPKGMIMYAPLSNIEERPRTLKPALSAIAKYLLEDR